MFESYEAISAYGTWFSGITMALTLGVTLLFTYFDKRKKIMMILTNTNGKISLEFENKSASDIIIRSFGIYVCGNYYSLFEDTFIVESSSIITCKVTDSTLDSQKTAAIDKISRYILNSYFVKRKYGDVSKYRLCTESCQVKLAIRTTEGMYLSRRWLSLSRFDNCVGMVRNGYNMRRFYDFDPDLWPLGITILILTQCLLAPYTANPEVVVLGNIMLIVTLYFLMGRIALKRSHTKMYYVFVGLFISLTLFWSFTIVFSLNIVDTVFIFYAYFLSVGTGIIVSLSRYAGVIGYDEVDF